MEGLDRVKTGSAYLYGSDGCGGVMSTHYKPGCGPVKDTSMSFDNGGKWVAVENKPERIVDNYSSGVCPGFTLPATEPKWQRDLYERERQIETRLAMEEENRPAPRMQLVFQEEKEEETDANAVTSEFTNEEWEAMAALVD